MKKSRRRFLLASLSIGLLAESLVPLVSSLRNTKKQEGKKTVKLLTQDGKLVEIDADKIPAAKQTATKQDIQHWVIKNKTL